MGSSRPPSRRLPRATSGANRLLVILVVALSLGPLAAPGAARERISINADWRFQKGDDDDRPAAALGTTAAADTPPLCRRDAGVARGPVGRQLRHAVRHP